MMYRYIVKTNTHQEYNTNISKKIKLKAIKLLENSNETYIDYIS